MVWEPMTIEEYAAFESSCGSKVVKVRDVWWIETRPFFFRPLFPFAAVAPEPGNYPFGAALGGILHPVVSHPSSNSHMHLFLFEDPQGYCVEKLNIKERQTVRKAARNFSARRLTDLDRFIEEAYPIYRSFYQRTGYHYKKERLKRTQFAAWAKPLFEQKKVVVIGAFHGEKLCAVEVCYQVEDVIIEDVYFSDTPSLVLQVTEFMTHSVREAAKASDARYIFRGFPSGKQSLDESKVMRGCKILKLPAYFRLNPVVRLLVKNFMKESYRKLQAITSLSEFPSDKVRFSAAVRNP